MAKTLDRFQPTLFEFPIQNNRTGWHPVWTPTLLVVPWSYDINGSRIANSKIKSATFTIEKLIQIEVAGHPQTYPPLGVKPKASPDKILFEVILSYDELYQHRIDINDAIFYKADGSTTDTPEEGDQAQFVNSRGITGRVEYLPDAEYFDLSAVEIAVDNLPSNRYIASWMVEYNERIQTDDVLFCISDNLQYTKLDYPINHPGEIHDEMVKRTPAVYFENVDKKQDFTVNLYRPFADALQDIFDESELFYGINWIKKIPPQLFPYLSYLIGVELPTQSGGIQNLDKIRRRMLERGAELQKLKGSELAIKELFLILGFTIDIIKLWVSTDGTRFIAPNEPDPNQTLIKEEIKSTPVSQTDPLVADYQIDGFGGFEVPLLYHNNDGYVVISAFQVGGDAYTKLVDITNKYIADPDYFTSTQIVNGPDGYQLLPQEILDVLDLEVEAYSRLVVSDIEVLSQQHKGLPVVRFDGIKYNVLRDKLNITFADYKNLAGSSAIFIYATYVRNKIEVPVSLQTNMSNRFDVKIVSKAGEIESSLYDYLIDSLFKFKAFHSLLRKVSYDAPLSDFYNVTDLCNNAYLSGQHDSDANSLMCPPACPTTECYTDSTCSEKNARGGLRESDYNTRNIILDGLKEEYDRWHDVTISWLDIASKKQAEIEKARSISNIEIPIPINVGDNYGQDRVSYDFTVTSSRPLSSLHQEMVYKGAYLESAHSTGTEPLILIIVPTKYQVLSTIIDVTVMVDLIKTVKPDLYYISMSFDVDHQNDVRSKITDLDRLSTPDYCYEGRVRDYLKFETDMELRETVRNRPCNLMMGSGVYYWLDAGKLDNVTGWYNDLLEKSDQMLHYSNNNFFEDAYLGSVLRPSLNIEKVDQGFPGHRSIRGGLLNNYTHPDYKARPWDLYDTCFEMINPLNSKIEQEIEIDGIVNEKLVYDISDLIYKANFVTPDISDFSGVSSTTMTHTVYSTAEERPYVDFNNIVHTSDVMISTGDPIFETAAKCGTELGDYTDYIDGYPAQTGDVIYEAEDVWSQKIIEGNIVIEADVLPGPFTVAATFSSEVRVSKEQESLTIKTYNEYDLWKGYRFDCDCDKACGTNDRNCNLSHFENSNGEYDFNDDRLDVKTIASLREKISTGNLFFDGEIQDCLNWDFGEETGQKEFRYKDEYDIEYKVTYVGDNNTVDITTESFQPRVWGENSIGYMVQGKVFRKGILTTIRQIFIFETGEWKLSAEGNKQEVMFRQTNYDCDVRPPGQEQFTRHFEYEVNDAVKMLVSCGQHWTDPSDTSDTSCVWEDVGVANLLLEDGGLLLLEDGGEIILEGGAVLDASFCMTPFGFINVWG